VIIHFLLIDFLKKGILNYKSAFFKRYQAAALEGAAA
jgi:hypothetical protein